jgi:hypothetical protein
MPPYWKSSLHLPNASDDPVAESADRTDTGGSSRLAVSKWYFAAVLKDTLEPGRKGEFPTVSVPAYLGFRAANLQTQPKCPFQNSARVFRSRPWTSRNTVGGGGRNLIIYRRRKDADDDANDLPEQFRAKGHYPRGVPILDEGGRMAAIITPSAQPNDAPPPPERMIACSGRYRIEPGGRFITDVDIGWLPAWLRTPRGRQFSILDGELHLTWAREV